LTPDDIVTRISAEYVEMPGLRVTHQQAQRLWGIDSETCTAALDQLVSTGFLYKTHGDQYALLTGGPTLVSIRMAKAGLRHDVSGRIAV
jgi:hypothetical protein